MKCNCIQILTEVRNHAKQSNACSRYVLSLDRTIECLKTGNSKKAIKLWNSWFDKKIMEENKNEKDIVKNKYKKGKK